MGYFNDIESFFNKTYKPNRGKSYYEKRRPRMRRDWTQERANDWIQADDLTPPAHFYLPDGN
ncbi:MAG: hypothetical protein ACEQSB_07500, partial [Undibacterium sp.]